MVTFSVVDYCLFASLLIISALIGVYYALKERWQIRQATADDILMGGREMGIFPVAMSLIASYMSAITVLGIPTEIYLYGTGYWLVAVSGLMTYPVTCYVFLPFFHNMGLSSAYQYLEFRFNKTTRYLASVIFAIEMLLYMAVVLYAPSLALNQVTGLSVWGSILAVGTVVTFYTSMAGLRAVLWTDTFQTFVVVGGLIAIIAVGSDRLGGITKVWRAAEEGGRLNFFNFDPSPFTRMTIWSVVFGSFIGQLTIYGANQTMLQRYMSIRNVKNSQIALFISLPATTLLVSLVCLTGIVIFVTYKDCDPLLAGDVVSRDQLLPFLVMDSFGHIKGAPGVFVACLFAAALSSVSSCLNALSITLLEDIVKPILEKWNRQLDHRTEAWLAKILGVIGGGVVIALAFLSSILGNTVLQIMITALGMGGGPLLGLFLLGMFFPCVNAKGAVSGIIVSSVITFWIAIGAFVLQVPQQELPLSTKGCPMWNSSAIFNNIDLSKVKPVLKKSSTVIPEEWASFSLIYKISFLWYPTISVIVSLITGILVSWVTGWQSVKLKSKFVYPVAEKLCCCLPKSCRKWLNDNPSWKYNKQLFKESFSDDDEESVMCQNSETTRESARLLSDDLRKMDSCHDDFETRL